MSTLRILALSYLASAGVFLLAVTWAAHPDLGLAIGAGLRDAGRALHHAAAPAIEALRRQDARLLDRVESPVARLTILPLLPGEERVIPHDRPTRIAPRALTPAPDRLAEAVPAPPIAILPDLSPEAAPVPAAPRMLEPRMVAPSAPRAALPRFDIAPQPHGRAEAAALRLKSSLTPEMLANFDLFLFVSKAAHGPLAQRLYVFRKQGDGLQLLHDWAASTGREQDEISPRGRKSFTSTPAGFYQLDPDRMYARYHSWNWNQDMPHAMFFNWERQGYKTGLAIHSATGADIARLGNRASAGCVHLSPENAATLYRLIQERYRGAVPRFAYNGKGTMTNTGAFMHRADGRLAMGQGYRVLVDIDDFGGREVIARAF